MFLVAEGQHQVRLWILAIFWQILRNRIVTKSSQILNLRPRSVEKIALDLRQKSQLCGYPAAVFNRGGKQFAPFRDRTGTSAA
jgi:hypothetical protein